jgi:hypothetical protein
MQRQLAHLETEVYRLRPTIQEIDRVAARCDSQEVLQLLLKVHETQAALEARVEALEKEAQLARLEARLPEAALDSQLQEGELQELLSEALRTKQMVRAYLGL